jgi:hypothetical protein
MDDSTLKEVRKEKVANILKRLEKNAGLEGKSFLVSEEGFNTAAYVECFVEEQTLKATVFQIPHNEDTWDNNWADSLRIETKGNPHGPHIKIYPNQTVHETGEKVTFIRCKHTNLKDSKGFVEKVFHSLEERDI